MMQMKPTEKGFLIKDINMETQDTSDTEEKVLDTTDYLNQLGEVFFSKDLEFSKKQLSIITCLNAILCRSYVDVFDILDQQASNMRINDLGWDFLMKMVRHLINETQYSMNPQGLSESSLNQSRIELGRYFVSRSFLCTKEVSPEVAASVSKRRSEQVTEMRKEYNAMELRFPIVDYFTSALYRDAPLTNKFVSLFFWDDPMKASTRS